MPLETALVAAPLLLLIAGLGMAISMRRRRERIGPGMTGDAAFIRLQRAHGNAVEHFPILLLGLMAEQTRDGGKTWQVTWDSIYVK